MNENMNVYEQVRQVPEEAQKPIKAGRLKGMTDINPMWRIKKLTEIFGMVGHGWYYEIVKQWIEEGADGVRVAFCNINLYVLVDGEYSKPIPGTGGSTLVASERNGLYTSDEAYKMALTDALSVACKALGFGADIYWQADRSKYSQPQEPKQKITQEQVLALEGLIKDTGVDKAKFLAYIKVNKLDDLDTSKYGAVLKLLQSKKNES